MKRNVFNIADIIVKKVEEKYGDSICIVAYYGSQATGTATDKSDLDMFFIPVPGKNNNLNSTFFVNNIPFDIYPMEWDFAEKIAEGDVNWSLAVSIISNAKVLYYRSQKELDRFNQLKERIKELCSPECRLYMTNKAVKTFEDVYIHYYKILNAVKQKDEFEKGSSIWRLAGTVINSLCLLNQCYFDSGLEKNLGEKIDALAIKPDGLKDILIRLILKKQCLKLSLDELRSLLDTLIDTTRSLLFKKQQEFIKYDEADFSWFINYYPEIREHLNKIINACEKNDLLSASHQVYFIQDEIARFLANSQPGENYNDHHYYMEYSQKFTALHLIDLSCFLDDPVLLAEKVEDFDRILKDILQKNGISLHYLESISELSNHLDRT